MTKPASNDRAEQPAGDAETLNSGALERHPRFEEVRQAYNEWRDSLPESERGSPGRRNWRAKCVEKACSLLWAKTGRVTAAAVMQIIKFGSTTSVNSDVRAWLRGQAPRREAWLERSGLIESPSVQDAFRSAFQMLLATAQTAARKEAKESLDVERAEMASAIGRMREEVEIAERARETALRAAAQVEARTEVAEKNRQQSESRAFELEGLLGAKTVELDQAASREAELRREIERVRQETDAAISRLEFVSQGYAKEIQRMEGANSHALLEIEKARSETRQAKDEIRQAAKEVATLTERIAALNTELIASARVVGEAHAELRLLREQLQRETRRADDLQAELGKQGESVRANEKMRAEVLRSALSRPVIVSAMRDNEATLQVGGGTLPKVWLAKAGLAITPTFDSLSELEDFCEEFRADLADFTSQIPARAFWSQDSQGKITKLEKKAGSTRGQAKVPGRGA